MSASFRILAIAAATAGLAAALPAGAQTPGSDRRLTATENRETRQDNRIAAGTTSGQIDANEAARLDNQQARIDAKQDRLAADGHFSRRDYARVNQRQTKSSRTIARARNNKR